MLGQGPGTVLRDTSVWAVASPCLNHTQAFPSPTARWSVIPLSHPHWMLAPPGPGRVAWPLGLDPETLMWEPQGRNWTCL